MAVIFCQISHSKHKKLEKQHVKVDGFKGTAWRTFSKEKKNLRQHFIIHHSESNVAKELSEPIRTGSEKRGRYTEQKSQLRGKGTEANMQRQDSWRKQSFIVYIPSGINTDGWWKHVISGKWITKYDVTWGNVQDLGGLKISVNGYV